MSDTIRVWTRQELEQAAANDPNERTMLRLAISPRMLLLLLEYQDSRGEDQVELLSAYGDPDRCELRFFRRDRPLTPEIRSP